MKSVKVDYLESFKILKSIHRLQIQNNQKYLEVDWRVLAFSSSSEHTVAGLIQLY